ncbi:MAG: hypothetical protein ACOX45_06990 [Acutalibacteraceae bacterium]
MGNYFLMSFRFNKSLPEDFGLIKSENLDLFKNLKDGSFWIQRSLYDYGWGKENGFCKTPIPDFNELVDIILSSKSEDDKYGAAAIILEDFCTELLDKCFKIFEDEKNIKKYCSFFEILHLDTPINRSPIKGKHFNEVSEDFEKWKQVSIKVKQYLHKK